VVPAPHFFNNQESSTENLKMITVITVKSGVNSDAGLLPGNKNACLFEAV